MVILREIDQVISGRFPTEVAEEWDNPGIQLGHLGAEIHKVLVALELTESVAKEAINGGFELVLTHHPFIFRAMKSICDRTPEGRMLLDLAEHRIALMAAHTNLDAAPGAIAQKLADDLGLENREVFLPCERGGEDWSGYGYGVSGELPMSMKLGDFIMRLKDIWGISSIRVAGDAQKMVQRVAIVNGSGARYLNKCRHIDAYITGDCGHHDFDQACRLGVALIDAGHYETEKYIVEILAETLKQSALGDQLEVTVSKCMCNPMQVL